MKIQIESTEKLVTLVIDGALVPARVWEGATESEISVHAFITRVAVRNGDHCEEFERELQECRQPSFEVADLPSRLTL